jgi:hypothetical protein
MPVTDSSTSPRINGGRNHSVCIRDLSPFTPASAAARVITLVGHRDAIMWTGFSPDDTHVATVAWDRSVRIWLAQTGVEKWLWRTEGQNWAGAWNHDGGRFLGTCGNGSIHLWNVDTGDKVWHFTHSCEWYRHVSWSPPIPGMTAQVNSGVHQTVEEKLDEGLIAIGGDSIGRVILLTPHAPHGGSTVKRILQEHTVTVDTMPVSPEIRRMAGRFLSIGRVSFLACPEGVNPQGWGVRVAYSMDIEGGMEVVDLVFGRKWRFGTSSETWKGTIKRSDWLHLPRTGQMLSIAEDGVRFFAIE